MKKLFYSILAVPALVALMSGVSYADGPPLNLPEPSTWLLLATGVAGLAAYRRFRNRDK